MNYQTWQKASWTILLTFAAAGCARSSPQPTVVERPVETAPKPADDPNQPNRGGDPADSQDDGSVINFEPVDVVTADPSAKPTTGGAGSGTELSFSDGQVVTTTWRGASDASENSAYKIK